MTDNSSLYANLAIALQNLNRNDEAVIACQEALRINPTVFSTYNTLGNALWAQGQLEKAAAAFRKALTVNARSANV